MQKYRTSGLWSKPFGQIHSQRAYFPKMLIFKFEFKRWSDRRWCRNKFPWIQSQFKFRWYSVRYQTSNTNDEIESQIRNSNGSNDVEDPAFASVCFKWVRNRCLWWYFQWKQQLWSTDWRNNKIDMLYSRPNIWNHKHEPRRNETKRVTKSHGDDCEMSYILGSGAFKLHPSGYQVKLLDILLGNMPSKENARSFYSFDTLKNSFFMSVWAMVTIRRYLFQSRLLMVWIHQIMKVDVKIKQNTKLSWKHCSFRCAHPKQYNTWNQTKNQQKKWSISLKVMFVKNGFIMKNYQFSFCCVFVWCVVDLFVHRIGENTEANRYFAFNTLIHQACEEMNSNHFK